MPAAFKTKERDHGYPAYRSPLSGRARDMPGGAVPYMRMLYLVSWPLGAM